MNKYKPETRECPAKSTLSVLKAKHPQPKKNAV
jgi:hypothetical protein